MGVRLVAFIKRKEETLLLRCVAPWRQRSVALKRIRDYQQCMSLHCVLQSKCSLPIMRGGHFFADVLQVYSATVY